MKRYVNRHLVIRFEYEIEVFAEQYSDILSATDIDMSGTEYDDFITDMISNFRKNSYSLSYEEDYTHHSNFPGSMSEYFTFTKWYDDVEVIVVVNVRLSDHPDKGKYGMSARQKRVDYVNRIGKEIADKHGAREDIAYPIDIVFDDKHFTSFSSAQAHVRSELKRIEAEVQQIIEENEGTEL